MSRGGSKSPDHAAKVLTTWITRYRPDTVILEIPDTAKRKSDKQRAILSAFVRVAEDAPVLNIAVARQKTHRDMYLMAADLVTRHPQIKAKQPQKPKIWMPEPRETIYFEALGMAEQVLVGHQSSVEDITLSKR